MIEEKLSCFYFNSVIQWEFEDICFVLFQLKMEVVYIFCGNKGVFIICYFGCKIGEQ